MTSTILAGITGNIQDLIENYQANKKPISDRMYSLLHALVILLTGCSICIAGAYAWGLGEDTPQSAILTATAIGIEVALVFFAAVMYPKPVMVLFGLIAGVGVLLISILTITSFLLSQQHQQEHHDIKQKEDYRAGLVADRGKLDINNPRDRGTIAILSNRIEQADQSLLLMKQKVPETKSTAIYHYIAKTYDLPVETVSLALRGLYGLIVVCTAVALAGYLETVYCPKSLTGWLKSYEVQTRSMNSTISKLTAISKTETPKQLEMPDLAESEADINPNDRHRRSGGGGDVSESMYAKVKESLEGLSEGVHVPVHQIRAITKRQPLAYGCIDRLMSEGIIQQEKNGRYIKV